MIKFFKLAVNVNVLGSSNKRFYNSLLPNSIDVTLDIKANHFFLDSAPSFDNNGNLVKG
jgi:hypothetical protein